MRFQEKKHILSSKAKIIKYSKPYIQIDTISKFIPANQSRQKPSVKKP